MCGQFFPHKSVKFTGSLWNFNHIWMCQNLYSPETEIVSGITST